MTGDLKSGTPAEVEIPAPAIVMIFVAFPDLMYSTIPSTESSANTYISEKITETLQTFLSTEWIIKVLVNSHKIV